MNGLTNQTLNTVFGSVLSVKTTATTEQAIQYENHFNVKEIGVLIGITGDIKGRLLIDAPQDIFAKLGEIMFGMALDGEMIISFTGEFGNMIAGNLATVLAQQGTKIDITPPTVLSGRETTISGFDQASSIPVYIETIGTLNVVLMLAA